MRIQSSAPYFLLALFLALVFGPAVAPSVGMGPSSILTAALAAGGLGPVPGYPIHNLAAKLIMLWPGFPPVYALNLTSFIFSVLALLLAARLLRLATQSLTGEKLSPWFVLAFGAVLGVLFFQSPSLTRLSFYCERYSTELFFIFLAANFAMDAQLLGLAFLSTFTFFCHAKSLPLVWFFYVVAFLRCRKPRPELKWQAVSAGAGFLVGVVALVLLSWRDPLFDWNNPETLRNLLNSFTRREYAFIHLARPWADGFVDWQRQYRLLFQQFSWPVFILMALAVGLMIRRSYGWAVAALGALIFTGEWTAFVQHYSNPGNDLVLQRLYDWMMLNYFGPYYATVAWLAVLGGTLLCFQLPAQLRPALGMAAFVVALVSGVFSARSMASPSDRLSEELTADFEKALPVGGVLFTNVDSLFASLLYHQMHEGRLKDRVLLHPELMFRSWYLNDVERLYPNFWTEHRERLEGIRKFIREFEVSNFDESKFRFGKYLESLNGLASDHLDRGVYVYFDPSTQGVRQGLFFPFQWDPEIVAFRLRRGSYRIPEFETKGYVFNQLIQARLNGSIWADRFLATFAKMADVRLKRARVLESEEVPRVEHFIDELTETKKPLRP